MHSVTLDFTSSQRDVAQSISDAAERPYRALGSGHHLEWEQLPLRA
ncbi:MAG TPA: hypothetical protein H9830_06530 [Candidatus Agrococcus pullicola]|uniref:Uncharacterized protein n=1 Tax=Candidatus Agrococcus pullicola TaxID=2838429 RepID=A0A9D1YUW1_9MICO|nr:hypothetical protein [Candidatus Agrococcus pullicola]